MGYRINLINDGFTTTGSLLHLFLKKMDGVNEVSPQLIFKMQPQLLQGCINIFCRCCDPAGQALIDAMSKADVNYIYYVDDNLWELKGDNQLGYYHSHPDVLETLNRYVKNASLIITGTQALKGYLCDNIVEDDQKVVALPNFLDFDLLDNFSIDEKNYKKIRIGYAGSQRRESFDIVASALKKIHGAYSRKIEIEFIGSHPPEEIQTICRHYDYLNGYKEYLNFQQKRNWDIALAPLEEDLFNSYKTDNKYRTYGALGVVGIYSDVKPYSGVIKNGENGLLAMNDEQSWIEAIEKLVTDGRKRKRISKNARQHVKEIYSVGNVKGVWERTILKEVMICAEKIDFSQRTIVCCKPKTIRFYFYLFFKHLHNDGFIETAKKVYRKAKSVFWE